MPHLSQVAEVWQYLQVVHANLLFPGLHTRTHLYVNPDHEFKSPQAAKHSKIQPSEDQGALRVYGFRRGNLKRVGPSCIAVFKFYAQSSDGSA